MQANDIIDSMEFSEDESPTILVPDTLSRLKAESLVGTFCFGDIDHLNRHIGVATHYPDGRITEKLAPGPGMVVEPTVFGITLFLWAMGRGRTPAQTFVQPDFSDFGIVGIRELQTGLRVADIPALPAAPRTM